MSRGKGLEDWVADSESESMDAVQRNMPNTAIAKKKQANALRWMNSMAKFESSGFGHKDTITKPWHEE